MYRPQTNSWLLANKPHFPTEPCRNCGGPVVQYRKRRYDGELRYCNHKCQQVHKPVLAKAVWPPKSVGHSSRIPAGCKGCKTGRQSGLCSAHRNILHKFTVRLRWLLPKNCLGCGDQFNRFDQGSKCNSCKRASDIQARQIRRLRKKGGGVYDAGIDYTKLYQSGDGLCAICRLPCDDPSVWLSWEGLNWMPNAPTVDHIVALANGGTHTWNNVQLACLRCNSHKSNRS